MLPRCINNFDAPCIYAVEVEGLVWCAWNPKRIERVVPFVCPRGDEEDLAIDNRKIYKNHKHHATNN